MVLNGFEATYGSAIVNATVDCDNNKAELPLTQIVQRITQVLQQGIDRFAPDR